MIIETEQEFQILKEAGGRLASILFKVMEKAKPGAITLELDEYAEKLILESGGRPSFKGYKTAAAKNPFPASLCVSINNEVVHGIPSKNRILREGDLVSFDLGMEYKSFYVDMARTIGIGKIDKTAAKLLPVGEHALQIAASKAIRGNYLGDIGAAVQRYVESNGFNVCRKLVGHGVGRAVHEEPEIPNFGKPKTGLKLENGMILALEPMVIEGEFDVALDKNGWTWKTKDGSRAVHFEDTVIVGEKITERITNFDKLNNFRIMNHES